MCAVSLEQEPAEVNLYDLVLVGSVGRSVMHRFDGTTEPILGGPIVHAALATSWSDKRVAVVTRMAPADHDLLEPLSKAGIDVYVSPVPETTRGHIYYLSDNVEDRCHVLERSAGPFSLSDLAPVAAPLLHLAGVNRLEFPLEFLRDLDAHSIRFSVDMQALIRDADVTTGKVVYGDYPHKEEVAGMAAKIKLDVVEARLLTGSSDLETAAIQFEEWGTSEVMVTGTEGALVRCEGSSYFEPFTNRGVAGRTGRGDTAFASYLVRRMDFGVADALKFATALASMKMESPGLFKSNREEILRRMDQDRSAGEAQRA
jgi:sugar/nucleoside kinase (ribokinase family)